MDEFFNSQVAGRVYDYVMAMDPGEARVFATQIAHSMLHEHIEANRRTVFAKVDEINREIVKALERVNAGAAEISKASGYGGYNVSSWENQYRPRRDEHGRFSRSEKRKIRREMNADYKRYVKQRKEYDKAPRAQATFDFVSALGGNTSRANFAADAVGGLKQHGNTFAESWYRAGTDDQGTNARTYRRVGQASALLGAVNHSPQAQIASQLGQFVGEFGPEAEKVLGPHVRRTAYRYRGIEKNPDKELLTTARQITEGQATAHLRDARLNVHRMGEARAQAIRDITPEAKIVGAERTGILYFQQKLPDINLSELQRKSGKIPPSEGIIIDAKGNIVAQAVGYADDHYLPFNLRNLAPLQGGSYVRSRTTGGLTTEDIYTGLLSGARSVTVVSHSGVFTISFKDDFRGGRRYSDKAHSMVQRYAKTLDAVKSGQVVREKMPPEVRAEIREETENEVRGLGYTRQEIENIVRQRTENYQAAPGLRASELESLARQAEEAYPDNSRKRAQMYNEMLENAEEKKLSRYFKLDGQGYAAAMRALKEQYPYFIDDVSYATKREVKGWGSDPKTPEPGDASLFSAAKDEGYVAPRYLRPKSALEGYYETDVAGSSKLKDMPGGKVPAAYTNYANWGNNPLRGANRQAAPEEPEAETKPAEEKLPKSAQQQMRAAMEQQAARDRQGKILEELFKIMPESAYGSLQSTYPHLNRASKIGLDEYKNDDLKADQLIADIKKLSDALSRAEQADAWAPHHTAVETGIRAFRLEQSMRAGGETFDIVRHAGVKSATPYKFKEKPYQQGATHDQITAEIDEVDKRAQELFGDALKNVNLSAQTDEQLSNLSATTGKLWKILKDKPSADDPAVTLAVADATKNLPGGAQNLGMTILRGIQSGSTEGLSRQFEVLTLNAERMRALKRHMEQVEANDQAQEAAAQAAAASAPPAAIGGGALWPKKKVNGIVDAIGLQADVSTGNGRRWLYKFLQDQAIAMSAQGGAPKDYAVTFGLVAENVRANDPKGAAEAAKNALTLMQAHGYKNDEHEVWLKAFLDD